jgi:thioesterase domain-containing protein
MARQLLTAGREVGTLALIDPSPLSRRRGEPGAGKAAGAGEALLRRQFAQDLLALAGPGGNGAAAADLLQGLDLGLPLPQLAAAAQAAGLLPPELSPDETARLFGAFRATRSALDRYRPAGYPGRLTLLLAAHRRAASANGHGRADPATAWAAMAGGGAEIEALPGDHYSIVRPPAVEVLASRLARRLAMKP